MKIFLILIVLFADGHKTLSVKFMVPGGVDGCIMLASAHMHIAPPPVIDGHPVRAWSATCSAELPSDPA